MAQKEKAKSITIKIEIMEQKKYKVGDTFKMDSGKNEYTVVATFQDNGENFIIAKHPILCGFVTIKI